jgi:hypothetical protein
LTGSAQINFYMSLQNEQLVLSIRNYDSVIKVDHFDRIIRPFYQSVSFGNPAQVAMIYVFICVIKLCERMV